MNINYFYCFEPFKRVKLTDVKNLTLIRFKYTIGRNPIPQLTCLGSNLCKDYSPNLVKCFNIGTYGFDVKWDCKAVMSQKVRFGSMSVSCEGFNYPQDPYIINGSCALKYYLEENPTYDYHVSNVVVFWITLGVISLVVILCLCGSITKIKIGNTWIHTDTTRLVTPEYTPPSYPHPPHHPPHHPHHPHHPPHHPPHHHHHKEENHGGSYIDNNFANTERR